MSGHHDHDHLFKATVTKMEANRAHLQVEVDSSEVDKAIDRAYRRVAKRVAVPGFRKGRAPKAILQRHIGRGPILEEALDDLIPHAYAHAVASTGIEPIDHPQIGDVNIKEGEPLQFTVEVEVKPEVKTGDYRSIRLERPPVELAENAVDEALARIQSQNIRLVPVSEDTEAGPGLTVIVDYTTSVDGQEVPEAQDEGVELKLGTNRYLPEFEEGLLGMKAGETKDLDIPFPEDYPHEDLAGKTAVMRVTMREIKKEEVPELDDELAKAVGMETLAELREEIEKNLLAQAQHEADEAYRNEVIKAAVAQAEVDVPETLVKRVADSRRKDIMQRLEASKLTFEEYLAAQEETEESFEEDLQREAQERVRIDLVLEAIAKQEDIQVTEEDLQQEALVLSQTYYQPVEEMRRFIDRSDVRGQVEQAILRRKAADLLVEIAAGGAEAGTTAAEPADGDGQEDEKAGEAETAAQAASEKAAE